MSTSTSTDYADLFFEHLSALRRYAERVFLNGELLDADEESEKDNRLHQFMEVGEKCEFTPQQLIRLLYAELFDS